MEERGQGSSRACRPAEGGSSPRLGKTRLRAPTCIGPFQASALHFILFYLKREGLRIGKILKFHRTLDLVLLPCNLGAATHLAGCWEK